MLLMGACVVPSCEGGNLVAIRWCVWRGVLVCCVIFGWMPLHWLVCESVDLCSVLCEVRVLCS